jgi:hypothetical protein
VIEYFEEIGDDSAGSHRQLAGGQIDRLDPVGAFVDRGDPGVAVVLGGPCLLYVAGAPESGPAGGASAMPFGGLAEAAAMLAGRAVARSGCKSMDHLLRPTLYGVRAASATGSQRRRGLCCRYA